MSNTLTQITKNAVYTKQKHLNRAIRVIIQQAVKQLFPDQRKRKQFINQHLKHKNPNLCQIRQYFKNGQIRKIIFKMLQQNKTKYFINLIKKRKDGVVKYTILKKHLIIPKLLIKYNQEFSQNDIELQQRVEQQVVEQQIVEQEHQNFMIKDLIRDYLEQSQKIQQTNLINSPIAQHHNIDNSRQNHQSNYFYTHDINNYEPQVQPKNQGLYDLLNLDIQSKDFQISMQLQLIDNPPVKQQQNLFNQLLSQEVNNIQRLQMQNRTQFYIDASFQIQQFVCTNFI